MATVDGLTKTRMLEIEAASVVSGSVDVVSKHLMLSTRGGVLLDAGYVKGDKGDTGSAASVADVVGLQAALDAKAGTTHQHIIADVTGLQVALIPTGGVVEYGGDTAPSGWLMADGNPYSRTIYAALFAVYGTKFGAGDGASTFNVPNRNGRVGVGLDSTQTEFNIIGKTYGEKAHLLTLSELPSHSHQQFVGWGAGTSILPSWDGTTNKAIYGVNNGGASGGGGAHNNLQPSIAMNYIIKI
jgi:microcystin-dependent protein